MVEGSIFAHGHPTHSGTSHSDLSPLASMTSMEQSDTLPKLGDEQVSQLPPLSYQSAITKIDTTAKSLQESSEEILDTSQSYRNHSMGNLTAVGALAKPAIPKEDSRQQLRQLPFPTLQNYSNTGEILGKTAPLVQQLKSPARGSDSSTLPANANKVVDSGQEHTGRWTKEEHESFLSALQLYGKEWKKVAAQVKTRTVVQTRTHAQKYFQKLQKVLEGQPDCSLDVGSLEGGLLQGSGSLYLGSNCSNTTINAQSLAAMIDLGLGPGSEKKEKKQRTTKQQQEQETHQQQQCQQSQQTPRTTSTAEALLNMSADNFFSKVPPSNPFTAGSVTTATNANSFSNFPQQHQDEHYHNFEYQMPMDTISTFAEKPKISIKAPTLDDMIPAGKFPEPSPAACGKRKVAEIAAAQMLIGGVGGFSHQNLPDTNEKSCVSAAAAQDILGDVGSSFTASMPFQSEDDAFLAEVFGVEDGKATPPPTLDEDAGAFSNFQFGRGRGMLLQIVNPDNLIDEELSGLSQKRYVNGQISPSTPWDGQLEALVSHVQRQEVDLDTYLAVDGLTEDSLHVDATNIDDHNLAMGEIAVPKPQPIPLPLRNPRTPLQSAICNGSSTEQISELISSQSSDAISFLNERNDAGYHCLHLASSLGLLDQSGLNSSRSMDICRQLLEAGADMTCRDNNGNTAVHWAARAGDCGILELFLRKNFCLDTQNNSGETPLHWAMRSGNRGMNTVQFLVQSGARTNIFSRKFKRPLDVAAEGFSSLKEDSDEYITNMMVIDQRERRLTRWNLLKYSSQCRTLVLHHHECLEHITKSEHDWEVSDRIDSILSTLARRTSDTCSPDDDYNFNSCEITVSNEFERATLELLSRIHSAEYLAFVNDLSKELERNRKQRLIESSQSDSSIDAADTTKKPIQVVPFTPLIQRKIMKGNATKADGHSDTSFSAGSLKAARRAAGAVQHAVDCVLVGRNRNAFCVVRPPGHHAGINGLLSDAESCGFCLFNNVAAGAMHALSDEKHRPRCERCAIVDIDAHHGNGTEEIVRKCHDSGRLLFFSVHLYDHDKPKRSNEFQYKFYPGTGADDDITHNVINVPIAPLWREKDVIKSISLSSNGASEPRQTRQQTKASASGRIPSSSDLKLLVNIESGRQKPSGCVSTASESGESEVTQSSKQRSQLPSSSPHYPSHYLMGVGRLAYRRAIKHRLLPALRAFNPDLIIMSTGFDAARGDVGNARHCVGGIEAMGFDLEPEDYAWTSKKICEIADICCNGRVVSVLEGGYGRTMPLVPPPPLSENDVTNGIHQQQLLDKSFLSECAMQHLKGLVDPYYSENESPT